jgi:Flp pilus assembly pilin Flp
MKLLKTFWTDQSGQGLTEYASIVALVSVALILVLVAFRDELARIYNAMRSELNTQIGSINQATT